MLLKEVRTYETPDGKRPFEKWFDGLKNRAVQTQISLRLGRLTLSHYDDCKFVGDKVWELRIHTSPGYRVYFTEKEEAIIFLLAGGTKGTQEKDIEKAKQYADDFWRNYVRS